MCIRVCICSHKLSHSFIYCAKYSMLIKLCLIYYVLFDKSYALCVCVCYCSSPGASGDMKVPPVIQSCPPCISMIQQPLFDMLRCLFGRYVRTYDSTRTQYVCICEQVECKEAYWTLVYCTVLYCTVLYCTVLYCTALYCTALYCTVLNCIELYCIELYCIELYCIELYCTVLYSTVLYCIVLYCTVLYCTIL